jgi:predicted DsbA family dithiol-disulfide isomerase
MDLRVDIVSDVICPWCYIGKRRFDQALALVGARHRVAVTWRPFQLNPGMPAEGMARADYLKVKFGSAERIREIYDTIVEAGAAEGIAFAFDRIQRTPNTLEAHRLIRLGQGLDRQDAVVEAVFRAYFIEGRNIGDLETLIGIAAEAGIDARAAARYLASDADRELVQGEDDAARQMGIQGVPCFIFEEQYPISGALEPAVLAGALDRVAELVAQPPVPLAAKSA